MKSWRRTSKFALVFAPALLGGCDLVLGLGDYREGAGGSGTTEATSTSTSTSSAGACPTLTGVGDADRTATVGEMASVSVSVDGAADEVVWSQTEGPPIALPADGSTMLTYTPPYVHDTVSVQVSAKKAGCVDSVATVTLTPVASGEGVYVAPPPLGAVGAAGDSAHPVAGIDEAMVMAQAQGRPIYVAEGEYVKAGYVATSDVQLYGGYVPGPVWHRAHATHPSKLTMPHDYASTTIEIVRGFDCGGHACTLGGFTVAQTIGTMSPTSKGATVGVFVGAGGATLFENTIMGPGFPQTDGHGALAISDSEDLKNGGAGTVRIFSNRLIPNSGLSCVGVGLADKASMLDSWLIANNVIDISSGLDDSGGVITGDSASVIGNTIIVSAKATAAYGVNLNYFGNVMRAASGSAEGGIGCLSTGDVIDFNSIFGFGLAFAPNCNSPTHLLTVDPLVAADGHLQTGSPAIDYAQLTNPAVDLLPPWDIDGELRRQGSGLDLGADEVK